MVDMFWDNLVDVTIASHYYNYYAIHAARCRMAVSTLCTLASASCIYGWCQSQKYPVLFSIIMFALQVVSVLQPLFPYSTQLHAARYIYQDVTQLRDDIEATWMSFNTDTDDAEISSALKSFKRQYNLIESRFASADTFPHKNRLLKKAEKDAENYLKRYM